MRLEKDVVLHYSASFGVADKEGEQNKKLKTLVCHLVKLGGHKLL